MSVIQSIRAASRNLLCTLCGINRLVNTQQLNKHRGGGLLGGMGGGESPLTPCTEVITYLNFFSANGCFIPTCAKTSRQKKSIFSTHSHTYEHFSPPWWLCHWGHCAVFRPLCVQYLFLCAILSSEINETSEILSWNINDSSEVFFCHVLFWSCWNAELAQPRSQ